MKLGFMCVLCILFDLRGDIKMLCKVEIFFGEMFGNDEKIEVIGEFGVLFGIYI